jgi:hypothetical protein
MDEAGTILCVNMHDVNSWEEWHVALDRVAAEVAQATQRIDFILDDMTGFPASNPVPHLKTMMSKLGTYSQLRLIVTVAEPSVCHFLRSLLGMMIRTIRIEWHPTALFVPTMDEALAKIARDRAQQGISV